MAMVVVAPSVDTRDVTEGPRHHTIGGPLSTFRNAGGIVFAVTFMKASTTNGICFMSSI